MADEEVIQMDGENAETMIDTEELKVEKDAQESEK